MNRIYRDFTADAIAPAAIDGFTTTIFLEGHTLALQLRGTTAAQRAARALLDVNGDILLKAPTNKQIAALFKVSIPTLAKARALSTEERLLVLQGERPLVTAQDRAKQIVREFYSDFDIAQLIAAIGGDRVMAALDMLTMPMSEAAE